MRDGDLVRLSEQFGAPEPGRAAEDTALSGSVEAGGSPTYRVASHSFARAFAAGDSGKMLCPMPA